jgi:hypothetical protein
LVLWLDGGWVETGIIKPMLMNKDKSFSRPCHCLLLI